MGKTVQIPSSIEEARSELNGLGRLLTATEWQRSAIVAAYVEPKAGQGTSSGSGRSRVSAASFGRLGIAGLKSPETVLRYVEVWKEHSGYETPKPGEVVELPTKGFPETARTTAQRKSDARRFLEDAPLEEEVDVILEAAKTNPQLAAALSEHFGVELEDEEDDWEADAGDDEEPEYAGPAVPARSLDLAWHHMKDAVAYVQAGELTPVDRTELARVTPRVVAAGEYILEAIASDEPIRDWDAAAAELEG